MTPLELDRQIPKRGDQRQMEAWQRIGTYAAGLALDSAGVKGNADLLSRMDMIVAAGGGERDYAVDAAILSALPSAADPGAFLNEHLLSDLRPTLFLAQLSNLLAGNISIVHGVVGLVAHLHGRGGRRHRCRPHRLRPHRRGPGRSVPGRRLLQRAAARHVAALRDGPGCCGSSRSPASGQRQAQGGGMVLGSVGCFLVIESREHAAARGATAAGAYRRDRHRSLPPRAQARRPRTPTRQLRRRCAHHLSRGMRAVISGATGVAAATAEEAAFLRGLRPAGTRHRHGVRPLAGAVVPRQSGAGGDGAVAAAAVRAAGGRTRQPMDSELRQVLVTSWGHWRGEALAVVEAA